ncbi:MAG: maleylpyruvate isomerase N-terminal domain-containing protein [Dehalococcoidia bacterium]|nr:maleylpyruvate isomerase N-terminal domain-containing protein [Dehalococcoidia bacterium]
MADDDTRTLADERRRLLQRLEMEFHQVIRNVEACRIRDIDRPFIGDWSVKDIVGHLASWDAEAVTALRELREGRRPAILDFDEASLDEWNNDHVERKRDLDFFSVMEQLKGGHARLFEELEFVSDEDLVTEGSVANRLVLSVIDHAVEHWHEIAAQLVGADVVRRPGAQLVPEEAHAG